MSEAVHFHLCEDCAHIWRHALPDGTPKDVRRAAHFCPKCKSGPYRSSFNTMRDVLEVKRIFCAQDDPPAIDIEHPRRAAKGSGTR